MTRTPQERLQLARIGLGMIFVGTIGLVVVTGMVERITLIVGRAIAVLGLCYLATKGHRWASILLGVLIVVPGVTLVVAIVRFGWPGLEGAKGLLAAVLVIGGFVTFVLAGGSSVFAHPRSGVASAHDEA